MANPYLFHHWRVDGEATAESDPANGMSVFCFLLDQRRLARSDREKFDKSSASTEVPTKGRCLHSVWPPYRQASFIGLQLLFGRSEVVGFRQTRNPFSSSR
jgi:hypothetical protein